MHDIVEHRETAHERAGQSQHPEVWPNEFFLHFTPRKIVFAIGCDQRRIFHEKPENRKADERENETRDPDDVEGGRHLAKDGKRDDRA